MRKADDACQVVLLLLEAEELHRCCQVYRMLRSKDLSVSIYVHMRSFVDLFVTLDDVASVAESQGVEMRDVKAVELDHFGFDLSEMEIGGAGDMVIGFGEWFLAVFRDLQVDGFVSCSSREILTRALTNAIDKERQHWIYVPRGFDIVSATSIVERSLLNYRVLSWIEKDHGLSVYEKDALSILNDHPSYFVNSASDRYRPYEFQWKYVDSEQAFIEEKNANLFHWVNEEADGIVLGSAVIPDMDNQPMRVTYARVRAIETHRMRIDFFSEAKEIRSFFRETSIDHGLAMNFLFFVTEKTIATYNHLREDRPREQIHHSGWHIDYRNTKEGQTFPLYRKAAIAADYDSRLHFFRKRLEGGEIWINDQYFSWESSAVDPREPEEFCIYTPYAVKQNTEEYLHVAIPVGDGRVNVVIVNDEVVSVRKGDVILPNIGVVVSFEHGMWEQHFPGLSYDECGYCDPESFTFRLQLREPCPYQWAYGGGMFLVYEGEKYHTEERLMEEFSREGWLSDFSKQTQDTETFRLDKHPRTAIGRTRSGEVFLFVCSGRSELSVGADYLDMIRIADTLFEEVDMLMNLDGGASSFLGLVHHGEVIELNDITFTNDSSAGSLRPLNSILSIEYRMKETHR